MQSTTSGSIGWCCRGGGHQWCSMLKHCWTSRRGVSVRYEVAKRSRPLRLFSAAVHLWSLCSSLRPNLSCDCNYFDWQFDKVPLSVTIVGKQKKTKQKKSCNDSNKPGVISRESDCSRNTRNDHVPLHSSPKNTTPSTIVHLEGVKRKKNGVNKGKTKSHRRSTQRFVLLD